MSDDEDLPLAVALDSGNDAAPSPTPAAAGAPVQGRRAPVPVTLITGYLGAGKTTLVHNILTGSHGRRLAVIVNEYSGEPGIEPAFVQDSEGGRAGVPQWVELANGCLCCSVKAEFVQALEALLDADAGHAGKFDYVLVETTGLANPGPIMGELWTDEELEAGVVLDGVVAVVDGRHIGGQLGEARPGGAANEAALQVALADVVLLNKMDLLTPEAADAVEARLRSINAAATLLRATRSDVDLAAILDRGAYRLRLLQAAQQPAGGGADLDAGLRAGGAGGAGAALQPLDWLQEVAAAAGMAEAAAGGGSCSGCAPGCSDPAHSHAHGGHAGGEGAAAAALQPCAAHDAAVRTVAIRCSRPLDLQRFRAWVEGLLWRDTAAHADAHAAVPAAGSGAAAAGAGNGPELLRMKGLLDVAGSECVHLFQAVYELYDVVGGASWQEFLQGQQQARVQATPQQQEPPGRMSRLVLIGRHLDGALLQAQLEACAAEDAPLPP